MQSCPCHVTDHLLGPCFCFTLLLLAPTVQHGRYYLLCVQHKSKVLPGVSSINTACSRALECYHPLFEKNSEQGQQVWEFLLGGSDRCLSRSCAVSEQAVGVLREPSGCQAHTRCRGSESLINPDLPLFIPPGLRLPPPPPPLWHLPVMNPHSVCA